MKRNLRIIFGVLIGVFFLSGELFAQSEPSRQELENVLSRFINYRFGTVSFYSITNVGDINRALKSKNEAVAGKKEAEELLAALPDKRVVDIIQSGSDAGDDCETIIQTINMQGLVPPAADIFDKICSGLKSGGLQEDAVGTAYIITKRPEFGNPPSEIIALVISLNSVDNIEKNLRRVTPSNVFTYDEMKSYRLDTTFSASNLYDLVVNAIMQGNIENKTGDAQGIGNPGWYSPLEKGNTISLSDNEYKIESNDVQKFMRISEGQALDYYKYKPNEVIASMDLISWKKYPQYSIDINGNLVLDSFAISNEDLPQFGVELKYGISDLSYPSMWSERMTLSALWQSVKLGIILPTAGWSSLTESIYNVPRKLTNGGVGIAGAFDFPFKVIPQSGVFRTSFGYIFGDAVMPSYKSEPSFGNYLNYNSDYLIRANALLHYTFGMKIDSDYWLRFGIGGTVYSAEKWNYVENTDPVTQEQSLKYSKIKTETIGGLSGRFEFMSKNVQTPFGGSIQYFDEALGANIWLQIPVIPMTFALRLDASGYFVAFRDPHEWENSSVFIPQIRFIFNF